MTLSSHRRCFVDRVVIVALLVVSLSACVGGANISAIADAPKSPSSGAFVHLFEWHWTEIADECENFLGPKGFTAVQISPPNEHLDHHTWWARYQPVSYSTLTSRSGDETALRAMIERCNKAGVKVYADVVMNNWANFTAASSKGTAGSEWKPRYYPELRPEDFHAPLCGINSYEIAQEVWYCDLYGMPDLHTGADKVQTYVATYIKKLLDMGVAGLRIDAAKHIAPQDLDAILAKANRPWVFLEVIGTHGEAPEIDPRNYMQLGMVTDFRYGTNIATHFRGGIKNLRDLNASDGEFLPTEKALVFVDNHDRERGHGGVGNLTYKDGIRYKLANVFMLAHPFGYPGIMSGYAFTDADAGPPAGVTNCSNSAWVCQHRWPEIANMIDFRNYTHAEQSIDHWWDNGKNQIAFGRGDKGFVVINNEHHPLKKKLRTGLSAGNYCNVLAAIEPCSGQLIQVDKQGFARFQLPPMSATVIYNRFKQP